MPVIATDALAASSHRLASSLQHLSVSPFQRLVFKVSQTKGEGIWGWEWREIVHLLLSQHPQTKWSNINCVSSHHLWSQQPALQGRKAKEKGRRNEAWQEQGWAGQGPPVCLLWASYLCTINTIFPDFPAEGLHLPCKTTFVRNFCLVGRELCIKMQDLMELSLMGKARFEHRHERQVSSFMASWGGGATPDNGLEDCPQRKWQPN